MFSPSNRRAAILGLGLAVVMLNPPVVQRIDEPTTVFGAAPLYLWIVLWGLVIVATLVWAARVDAFGVSEAEVPADVDPWPGADSSDRPGSGGASGTGTED